MSERAGQGPGRPDSEIGGAEKGAPGAWKTYIQVMTLRPTALERAFTLAKSGDCAGPGEVKAILKQEGFSADQVSGPSLMRQLRALCVAARQANAEA